jgi:energy-coupling factor transporter ATP-binding protein EcfA2/GNAT superfamily N-acetyltransferase
MKIRVETPVQETVRVAQVSGIFDLPTASTSRHEWEVNLPLSEKPWIIGLITGPSGCGKSTISHSLWGDSVLKSTTLTWPKEESILDAFPEAMSIKTIVELLSSVGFSSPPSWLKPYHVLSTGQKFRVMLARILAEKIHETPPIGDTLCDPLPPASLSPIVFDEFTSTVDRTVAQVGSCAVAKTIRKHHLQFIAVTCHDDVEEWLQPDWTYRPAENLFQWRLLRRRPTITLNILRVKASAWPLFAQHHYLSDTHNRSAICFLATWKDRPVAYSSWIRHFGNGHPMMREHRTVTLPDYQGVGIGNALSDFCASLFKSLKYKPVSTTTHPAMIASRLRSLNWYMHREPGLHGKREKGGRIVHAFSRLTAGFTYIGPTPPKELALSLIYG